MNIKVNLFKGKIIKYIMIVLVAIVAVSQVMLFSTKATNAEIKDAALQKQLLSDIDYMYNSSSGCYEVEKTLDLDWIRYYTNNGGSTSGKTFKQINDIVIGYELYPIGNSTYKFAGTYDGGGFSISSLAIKGSGDRGLFGYVSGTIKNVVISSGTVSANSGFSAGCIAGSIYSGAKISNCLNLGCTVSADLNASVTIGGIVGYTSGGTIENCLNAGTVTTASSVTGNYTIKAGGITGVLASGASITGCYNKATVRAGRSGVTCAYAGGIVADCASNVTNCLNKGAVYAYAKTTTSDFTTINPLSSATTSSEYKASGQSDSISSVVPGNTSGSGYTTETKYAYIGGIAGRLTAGTISYCINTDTTNYKSYGGYVKYSYDMYYKLYNFAQLNGSYTTYIYGHFYLYSNFYNTISGYNTGGTISKCYHPSNVEDRFSTWNGTVYYYDGSTADGTKSFSCSAIGDYENEIFIDKKNYTSPQLLVNARRDTGIRFVYSPYNKDNVSLYTIPRPTNDTNWCLTTTGTTHLQSSTAIDTITSNNTTLWENDDGTPYLKNFYWEHNASKP